MVIHQLKEEEEEEGEKKMCGILSGFLLGFSGIWLDGARCEVWWMIDRWIWSADELISLIASIQFALVGSIQFDSLMIDDDFHKWLPFKQLL